MEWSRFDLENSGYRWSIYIYDAEYDALRNWE